MSDLAWDSAVGAITEEMSYLYYSADMIGFLDILLNGSAIDLLKFLMNDPNAAQFVLDEVEQAHGTFIEDEEDTHEYNELA